MENFVINIGRQLGSGGREIGEKIAQRFDARFMDKELIKVAAEQTGFRRELFEKSDERKGFFGSLFNFRNSSFGQNDPYAPAISEESMFQILSEVIRSAAAESSCVFVGRCADYILRDNPRCFNVFITADEQDRVERIAKLRDVTPDKALQIIEKADESRASFYNYYSSRRWGEAATYHLCINSSILGIDKTEEYIASYARQMLGI